MDASAQMFTMVKFSLTMLECYMELTFPLQNMILFNFPAHMMD